MLSPLDCHYYIGVIVILKIVISEFFPMHYTGHRISSLPYILVYKSNACISRTLFLKPKIQLF